MNKNLNDFKASFNRYKILGYDPIDTPFAESGTKTKISADDYSKGFDLTKKKFDITELNYLLNQYGGLIKGIIASIVTEIDVNGAGSLTGAVNIKQGSNITLTVKGNTITISGTGGAGGVTSVTGDTEIISDPTTGAVKLSISNLIARTVDLDKKVNISGTFTAGDVPKATDSTTIGDAYPTTTVAKPNSLAVTNSTSGKFNPSLIEPIPMIEDSESFWFDYGTDDDTIWNYIVAHWCDNDHDEPINGSVAKINTATVKGGDQYVLHETWVYTGQGDWKDKTNWNEHMFITDFVYKWAGLQDDITTDQVNGVVQQLDYIKQLATQLGDLQTQVSKNKTDISNNAKGISDNKTWIDNSFQFTLR